MPAEVDTWVCDRFGDGLLVWQSPPGASLAGELAVVVRKVASSWEKTPPRRSTSTGAGGPPNSSRSIKRPASTSSPSFRVVFGGVPSRGPGVELQTVREGEGWPQQATTGMEGSRRAMSSGSLVTTVARRRRASSATLGSTMSVVSLTPPLIYPSMPIKAQVKSTGSTRQAG